MRGHPVDAGESPHLLAEQLLEALEVGHLDADGVVGRAEHAANLGDLVELDGLRLERLHRGVRLAREVDVDEHLEGASDPVGVHLGVVAEKDPILLEAANSTQAGRRGEPHALREFSVRQSGVSLQFAHDCAIDGVHT
ncbi:hypothetical protein PSCLAVI8L_140108 [Pseudoclavibacter sp. 8L]|nr:hypothetical protein PSCLAVI8L_140108 [Pseudoclavibacter sp. 8L]